MSVLTYGSNAGSRLGKPGFLASFRDLVVDLGRAFADAWRMQATYNRLSAMSDGQLKALGLSRRDIPQALLTPPPHY
jgi:uncharacterized protein YjiS (DUF1127 family)